MAENNTGSKTYELNWQFNPRLITEHLGKNKYSSTVKALRELVANALDANASKVNIDIVSNELGEPSSIVVRDDGHGISPEVLKTRFREIAVNVSDGGRAGECWLRRLSNSSLR